MGVRWYGVKISLSWIGFVLEALLASGCGSVVYKDAATTYVVAGRAATKSIMDVANTLAESRDRLKATRIVKDPECPIGEPRIFLREDDASRRFKAEIGRTQMPEASDCKRFSECERSPSDPRCHSICYSAEEANCIATIEENAAIHLKSLSGSQADQFANAIQPLAAALDRIEYGRAVPIQNVLVKADLDALTKYLDLLEKLATKRESDVADDAKKLSDKLTSATTKVSEITGKKLSDAHKATQTQITSALTAMGKFFADIKVMAANAHDADAIRKIVAERGSNVEALIASIKEVAVGDAMLGMVYKNLAQMEVRQDLQSRYKKAPDAYDRRLLLVERDKYAYADGTQALTSVKALFDAMSKSHSALVQLVLNPSDKDRQAIANERFQQFKSIAEDVAALVQLSY